MFFSIFFFKILILIKEVVIFGFVGFITSILISPMAFFKTQKQETGLKYKDIFLTNLRNYGYFVFYSGFLHFAILNSISSASFGLIEGLTIPIIKLSLDPYSLAGILVRTISLGLFETLMIIYFDYKAIQKQKIGILENETHSLLSFFTPSFIKNTIIWFGTTISIYVIHKLHQNLINTTYFQEILISFTFGIFFSCLVLPFDVICVKRVGSFENQKKPMFKILKECIKKEGYSRIFSGGLFRVLMVAIFVVSTVLTDIFLKK